MLARQRLRHLRRHAIAERDIGQQRFQPRITMLDEVRVQPRRRQTVERSVQILECAVEHPMPELHRIFVLQALELMADRGTRLAGDHEFQPLWLRRRGLGADHLDLLSADELGPQRHQLLVHTRGDGVIADIRVHGIGKIQRSGVARQCEDVALGGEQVDLVGEQVDLDVLQELQRRAGRSLALQQVGDPRMRAALRTVGRATVFVRPMRGDATLGDQVHFLGANLHLDRRAVRAEQHRVQRLIAVGLGDGDEIAETPVQRFEHRMHDAQRVVALGHRTHHDAEAEDIHHLVERFSFRVHLGIDAPRRLDPADQPVLQSFLGQPLRHLRLDPRQRLAPQQRLGADTFFQYRMPPRVQRAEAEILQLGLDQVHAQALRDRRIDLQRLARNARARLGRLGAEGAHVVQTISQLDQNHTQVARHRQQHLAEALGRSFLPILELELVELGDAVDQFGHGFAELTRDGGARERRVLERVVQDRGDQRFDIDPLLRKHRCHRDGMGDVGLAGSACLPCMCGRANRPGAAQQPVLVLRQVTGGALQREHVVRQRLVNGRGRGVDGVSGTHEGSVRRNAGNGEPVAGNRNSGPSDIATSRHSTRKKTTPPKRSRSVP